MKLDRTYPIRAYHNSSAADLLKETMDFYKITQADLAERIGVSQKHISEILNRKKFMDETLALRIEMVMGISSELLLNLDSKYKLAQAKEDIGVITHHDRSSHLFLKRYDWVTV